MYSVNKADFIQAVYIPHMSQKHSTKTLNIKKKFFLGKYDKDKQVASLGCRFRFCT